MRNGNFSRYYNVSSPIHSLNPMCKIIVLFIFCFMSILCSNFSVLCSLFIILLYLIALSNVSFEKYVDVLFRLRFVYLFIFLFSLCFFDLYGSIIIVGRLCLIILYLFVLLYTTTTNGIIYGFSSFFKPLSFLGVRSVRVSMMFSLVLNFIPSYFVEYDKVCYSRIGIGLDFFDRLHIFSSVIKKMKEKFDVMVVNSYNVYYFDSSVYDSNFRFSDVYVIFCHVIILMFILVKEVVL